MKRLVIVGAGISGLAAAHAAVRRAERAGVGLDIVVLEAAAEVGGKARTRRVDGWLVEEGPAGYLDSEPEFAELLTHAGIGADCIRAEPSAARRYIYREGLREVKPSPLGIARSGILDLPGLLRLAAEPFVPRADEARRRRESIRDFAARRLGGEAADRLIAPAVLGVFAGDARELSLVACFPKLAELEREHGSLLRGMWARRRTGARPGGTGAGLTSTREGMQAIPRRLAAVGSFTTRCSAPVGRITRAARGPAPAAANGIVSDASSHGPAAGVVGDSEAGRAFRVWIAGDGESLPADGIVLAGGAGATAALIEPLNAAAAAGLREIDTPPLAVVALGYPPQVRRHFPIGFGVLIPRHSGYRILGSIWESQVFPGRCPEGHLLVRAMIGGAVDPAAADLAEADLVELARDELARLFGLSAEPVFTHAARWPHAIPQYDLDHPRRVERIEAAIAETPGLFLAGTALYGVAFAKAAVAGLRAGEAAVDWLGRC